MDAALPKCKGCSKPITDKALKALGGQWHVNCFVCKVRLVLSTEESRLLSFIDNHCTLHAHCTVWQIQLVASVAS
jgi:hypothetical protein